jgi:hypothetical protein
LRKAHLAADRCSGNDDVDAPIHWDEEPTMDADEAQTIAARDQLWSSLRALLPEIEQIAEGAFAGTEREKQIVQIVAKIVAAELKFRAEETK